jgi:hypothetical protein
VESNNIIHPSRDLWQAVRAACGGIGISFGFSLSSIPAQLLTHTFNGSKVIAVKVLGAAQGIPTVQYVHHEERSDAGCADIPLIR